MEMMAARVGWTILCAAALAASRVAAGGSDPVKFFVMLPLDTVSSEGTIANTTALTEMLDKMQWAGVDGFMVDIWWGLTEPEPGRYNFEAYRQVFDMARARGWKVQAVASFHQCGGNYGDSCNITVPSFVHGVDGIWYKDADGVEDREYISLFADDVQIGGRTPLDMYRDWLDAFVNEFSNDLGGLITEVMVGLGPAGELRYPSYRGSWSFCGVGEFQAFDAHALASLEAAAARAGQPGWAHPPEVASTGNYSSRPLETSFFTEGFRSDYGRFFLDWYSSALKEHGGRVLAIAREVLESRARISAKVAGVHWWYDSDSHGAEATAGYYNTNFHNAYDEIAALFAKHNTSFDFTSFEMRNDEALVQHAECLADPETLVQQVLQAAAAHGVPVGGENALRRYDQWAYDKIETYREHLDAFTYLRLDDELVKTGNLARFRAFVAALHGEGNNLAVQTQLRGSLKDPGAARR